MAARRSCVCLLLWISLSAQTLIESPDATVTCFVSGDCVLPCVFQQAKELTIQWFRQDVMVYWFQQSANGTEKHVVHEQFEGRASISLTKVSHGNATLTLQRSRLKDRGIYKCVVSTLRMDRQAKVILKVLVPIRGLSLVLSRMSGYEEMICTIDDVYPAPRVSWSTEPSTFEDLRPVTRVNVNKDGLYMLNSRLKLVQGQPNLIYICNGTTSYGSRAWSTSLREREIKGSQGKDVTIPCFAPPALTQPTLEWSFHNGQGSSHILTYNRQQGLVAYKPPWEQHVELDTNRVQFGDGSLRLMDPESGKHTGSYTCVFSTQYSNHTERSDVLIHGPADAGDGGAEEKTAGGSSCWWVAGLVIAVLALAVVGLLVYLKLKGQGNTKAKPRHDPEEATELNMVKGAAEEGGT